MAVWPVLKLGTEMLENLGLFWAVPGQISGLLLVHMCCLCVKLWLECLGPKWP